MTAPGKILSKEIIAHWPEVFGDVKLNVLPLRYLHAILITFKDGKTWEILITPATKRIGWDSLEETLAELFKSYEEKIDDIDFKLDTERVRKDIEKSTQKFLKKRKL